MNCSPVRFNDVAFEGKHGRPDSICAGALTVLLQVSDDVRSCIAVLTEIFAHRTILGFQASSWRR